MPNAVQPERSGDLPTGHVVQLPRRAVGLLVHLTCGGLRGPHPGYGWQSCRCEDARQVWAGCDVSRATDLCLLCQRGIAGGTSRWAWEGCDNCRDVNAAAGRLVGRAPLPLGRHSMMNGVSVSTTGDPQALARGAAAFERLAAGWSSLAAWSDEEFRRLASAGGWPRDSDVPLPDWQHRYPPSRLASEDAFARLTGIDPQTLPT